MPNFGGRIFLAQNVRFNYTMKIGAGHYVGLMASNRVEDVKHMIIDKNSSDNPYIKAKYMYITTSPKKTKKKTQQTIAL
jgi:hypothetical protein